LGSVRRLLIAWLQSLFDRVRSLVGGGRARLAQGDDADAELREVFLIELREVAHSLQTACADWRANPADADALKRLRRGFHTIKGSAPLVGAVALAESCRHLESLMARLLDRSAQPTAEMVRAVEQAIRWLPACADALRDGRAPPAQLRAIGEQVRRFLG